jgi:hypothetical protein
MNLPKNQARNNARGNLAGLGASPGWFVGWLVDSRVSGHGAKPKLAKQCRPDALIGIALQKRLADLN